MTEVRNRQVPSLRERILSSPIRKSKPNEASKTALQLDQQDGLFTSGQLQGVIPYPASERLNPILLDMGYQESQSKSYLRQILREVGARDDGSAFFSVQLEILQHIARACEYLETGSDEKEAYDELKKAEKSAIGLILDPKAGYKVPLLRLLMIVLHNLAYFCMR